MKPGLFLCFRLERSSLSSARSVRRRSISASKIACVDAAISRNVTAQSVSMSFFHGSSIILSHFFEAVQINLLLESEPPSDTDTRALRTGGVEVYSPLVLSYMNDTERNMLLCPGNIAVVLAKDEAGPWHEARRK